MARPDDTNKPYIVWVDYGCEGWSPWGFDTLPEALSFISGEVSGPKLLTRQMKLNAADAMLAERKRG